MKIFFKAIVLILVSLIFNAHSGQCFDSPPIVESMDGDKATIEVRKVMLTTIDLYGYLSIENIGSENFDASLYFPKNNMYCILSLGPMTDFKINRKKVNSKYYSFDVFSKSGMDHFVRQYKYSSGAYKNVSCKVKSYGEKSKTCALVN